MICIRCEGRMVQERFVDLLSSKNSFSGFRCLNCGAIHDHVVLKNRSTQNTPSDLTWIEGRTFPLNREVESVARSQMKTAESHRSSKHSLRSSKSRQTGGRHEH